jgi:hypothetical protein
VTVAPSAVRLYSRRTCGLCDQARAVILAELDRGAGFRFEEVLVDGDPRLEAAYGARVPVVEIDGEEAFEYSVEPAQFRLIVTG